MLLSTTFYLSGLILFHKAVTSERKRGLYLAGLFVASLLGVASRENFATFPLMLLLYDALIVSRLRLGETVKHWRAYVPVALAFSYLAYIALHHTYAKHGGYGKDIPPMDYALTQLEVHWTYLRLLVLPINQNADYDYPIASTLLNMPTMISFVGYLCLWAVGILAARRRPAAAFAVLWFLVALLPVSFLVALADVSLGDVIFEHRLYLPSVGLIALAGAGVARLMRSPRMGKAATVAAVAIAISLGAATYSRNSVWSSGMTFWGDVIEKSPDKARGYNNIAIFYRLEGRTGEALESIEKATSIDPDIPQTHYNLANIYYTQGRTDEAEEHFTEAIRLRPEYVAARVNLGILYKQAGQMDKAIEQYEAAVSYEPRTPDAYYNLANAYMRTGRYDEAVPLYEKAISIVPDNADYHNNLSVAYRQLGLSEKADEHQKIAEMLRGKAR
jgi:Tfp pilus assembly protein PilF